MVGGGQGSMKRVSVQFDKIISFFKLGSYFLYIYGKVVKVLLYDVLLNYVKLMCDKCCKDR